MSISFACPECRVQIEVADEHAGESGQCPRCQSMIVIPSPKMPMPILTAAETVPPADPWAPPRESAKSKPRPVDADEGRPRRPRAAAAPKKPMGPIWPWVVGVFGAVMVVSLLFSSLLVLILWRRAEPTRPAPVVEIKQPVQQFKGPVVMQGQLAGNNRIVMQNGVFQMRSELNQNDGMDPERGNSRCKRYEVQLQNNRDYIVEMESNQFASEVRIETFDEHVLAVARSNRNVGGPDVARIKYWSPRNEMLVIYATSLEHAFGNFTLTIRDRDAAK